MPDLLARLSAPARPEDIKSVCAWCGAHLRGRADAPLVSHGMCPACLERALAEAKGARA